MIEAVEGGETFELRRNGRAVGYLTQTPPPPQGTPDWKAHFEWLREQTTNTDAGILQGFAAGRLRHAASEQTSGNQQ